MDKSILGYPFIEYHAQQLWLVSPALARLLHSQLAKFDAQVQGDVTDEKFQRLLSGELPLQTRLEDDDDFDFFVERMDDLVIISVTGTLSKEPMPSRGLFSNATPTLIEIEQAVERFGLDDTVREIIIKIESGGGSFPHLKETGDMIRAVRDIKPVTCYCDDRTQSAAYWLASQGTEVISNKTGRIGSIGVFALMLDTSSAQEMEGLRFVLVSSGGVKGLGADGRITEPLINEVQKMVSEAKDLFSDSVVQGRPQLASAIEMLSDGRDFFGEEALQLGLIDRVLPFKTLMDEKQAEAQRSSFFPTSRKREIIPKSTTTIGEKRMQTSQIQEDFQAELNKLKAELEEKNALLESQAESMRQRNLAVRRATITELCEKHAATGKLLPKHRSLIEGFLTATIESDVQISYVDGEHQITADLFTESIRVIDTLLDAQTKLVEFGTHTASTVGGIENDNGNQRDIQTEARALIGKYRLNTDRKGDGN